MFTGKERFGRAWRDTSLLTHWRRNLCIALAALLIKFALRWFLGEDWGKAVSELSSALLTVVVAFFLVPVVEFALNYVRAPRRILQDKVNEQQEIIIEQQRQLNEKRRQAKREDWIELAKSFKEIDLDIRADWHKAGNGAESWGLMGGSQRTKCKSLCALAGALLVRSPKTLATTSPNLRSQADPCWRWLFFLKEKYGLTCPVVGHENGDPIYGGLIESLGSKSESACLDCAANET